MGKGSLPAEPVHLSSPVPNFACWSTE